MEEARNGLEEKTRERTVELAQAKAFSEGILASMRDLVLVVDLDGNILSVNKAFEDWYAGQGYDVKQYIGKPAFELPTIPSEDIGKYVDMMEEVMRKGHAGPFEARSALKNGHEEYQSVIASLIKNAKDEPTSLVAVFRDITDTKNLLSELSDFREATIYMLSDLDKTSKELAESRDYIHNIIKSMIDTLLVVSPDGKIKTINPATVELLGYEEDELIGKPVATLFAEEEEEEEEEESIFKGTRLKKLIEEGSIRDCEMTYRTKSGEKVPVSFSGSVMRNKDGELVGIVGITRDMRKIKHLMQAAEETYRKKTAELEKTQKASLNVMGDLERRRKELDKAYRELQNTQAQLILKERLAVMGRLIADVSHEINNPLAIITSGTQLLEEMVKEQVTTVIDLKDNAKMFEKIRNATNRCKKIVAGLLVFARPTMLDFRLTDINKLIEESLESTDDQFKRQNIKLVKAFSPRLPMIKSDGRRLSQVFINIITNACDAMPKGGKLRIATRLLTPEAGARGEATGEESHAVEIKISDTGTGIREEDLLRIFDPFVTTKKDGKGVGLGLSISYGIIKEHGGSISVASEKGEGATFIIRLPVKGGDA